MTTVVAIVKRTAVDMWQGFAVAVCHPIRTLRGLRDVMLDG